ncbi:unnamed protein product [Calicophoron daubneyi]|uniref:Uncharacterized protein n=1 Tax=Calicophoron daubneyi TaxID=300641 RepID=A0AAV2TGC4_CALDB
MGDIGVWTPQGALKIVDRCKNIFKLAQGEYICPGKIEEICSSSPLIAYMYLDGNSLHPYPVAIIQPDFGMLRKRMHEIQFGESSGQTEDSCVKPFSSMSAEELCKNQLARRIIFDEMTTIGRKNGLKGFELPKAIHLTTEQFTIDNGMLTPTLKLSRPNVRRHFATTIQNLCTDTNAKV